MQSGKVVTIGIFAIAMLATACAWWYQRAQGLRALEFWGAADAQVLRHGREIFLWQLAPPSKGADEPWTAADPSATLLVDDRRWAVLRRIDLTDAPGLLHLRQALIVDASFAWAAQPTASAADPQWQFALEAQDEQRQVVALLDLEREWIRKLDGGPTVKLTISEGLRTFFKEALERDRH